MSESDNLPRSDSDQNFCRVFAIPTDMPNDFCFGGGQLVPFRQVDWFQPIPNELIASNLDMGIDDNESLRVALLSFLADKNYVEPGRRYLVLCDWGYCFVFEGTR